MESGMSAHGLDSGQDEMFSFHTNSLRKGMTWEKCLFTGMPQWLKSVAELGKWN